MSTSALNPQTLQKLLADANTDVPGADSSVPTTASGAVRQGIAAKQAAISQAAPVQQKGAQETLKDIESYDKAADADPHYLDQVQQWKPEKQPSDPISAFGSLGTVFAMIASGLTHQPMMNSLNAAASAINARRQNDDEAYNKAFQAWKENTDLAIKKNAAYMQHMQLLGDKLKLDPAAYQAQATLLAQQNNDKAGLAFLAAGNYEKLDELNMHRTQVGMELEKNKAQLEDLHTQQQLEKSAVAALGPNATPEDIASVIGDVKKRLSGTVQKTTLSDIQAGLVQQKAQDILKANPTTKPSDAFQQAYDGVIKSAAEAKKTGAATDTKLDDSTLDLLSDQWKSTGQIPNLGYGKDGAAMRKQVVEHAAKRIADSGGQFGDVLLQRANLKADSASLNQITKLTDNVNNFERTVEDNMQQVDKLIGQGAAGGGWPVVNKWIQAGRQATGDPQVASFNEALQTVASEYAKVMAGSTSASGAPVHTQQITEGLLNRSFTPEQIQQVFNTMRQDMANRQGELGLQRKIIQDRIGGKSNDVTAPHGPAVGQVIKGYRFKGGDPSQQSSWEKE